MQRHFFIIVLIMSLITVSLSGNVSKFLPDTDSIYIFPSPNTKESLNGSIEGTVREINDGHPIKNITIAIDNTNFNTTTDNNGQYNITGVPTGVYNITASGGPYPSPITKFDIQVTASNTTVVNFDLGNLFPGCGYITGRVTDNVGQPIENATISIGSDKSIDGYTNISGTYLICVANTPYYGNYRVRAAEQCHYNTYWKDTGPVACTGIVELDFELNRKSPFPHPIAEISQPKEEMVFGTTDQIVFNSSIILKPCNATLNFTWTSSISGIFGYGPRIVTQLPIGNHRIILQVKNSHNASYIDIVNITVINQIPRIESYFPNAEQVSIDEGENITFIINATDVDGDVLSYQWYINDDIIINRNTTQFTYYSDYHSSGIYIITVSISDGKSDNTYKWNLTVQNINLLPMIEIISPLNNSVVNGTLEISGRADDIDGTIQMVRIRLDNDQWQDASGLLNWTFKWNTTIFSDGPYTISAESFDGTDYSPIDSITVIVNNSLDFMDSDNDGTSDDKDAFPNDPSASLDSDNDGHPDEWNPGMDEDNSTTNLTIDDFPDDPEKWEKDNEGDTTPWVVAVIIIVIILSIIGVLFYFYSRRISNEEFEE